jgi:hypothetical protein
MRWLFNYLRQVFCQHNFKFEEAKFDYYTRLGTKYTQAFVVSRTCEKCGWHTSYLKHK